MATYKRTEGMDSSKSPRSSKSHHSRSRSRSRDRKRDKKHRQSRSRSKEGRRKDSDDRPSKSRKPEERQEQTERAKERLSESGDERHRRKGGASTRRRSRSRSRSRERHHRSRSRDRKRSRSRSRERRSRSRDRKRRARSRSRSRSKHRHRSRSRSKSRERRKRSERPRAYSRSRSRSVSPLVFQGRNTAMDAQEALARRLERAKKLQEQKEKEMLEVQKRRACRYGMAMCDAAATVAAGSSILNMAAFLAAGTPVAPHIAMAAQMAALQAKALAETGAAVPSFYNPSAVNAVKLAEQDKKRKMLWQGKKEGDKSQTAELWEKLSFGNKDQNTKFRKLMGIKEEGGEAAGLMDEESLKTLRQQEEMFRNLDVQYEMARSQTHTQRGMGLGFSSSFASRGMDTL
ncbi:arginine/serine-rich coiled-coil protein 2-like [Anguilla rostrata]|uniref:arginine/serine-rich coiled-coil protein 2-like n=1 Tax=Anguilla rostrata TaxID=7938 RepID=UPI0030CEDAF9